MKQLEARLSEKVSEFLQKQYPKVIYRFDIADLKLTMPQAVRNKKLQGDRKGYPDLFIAKPSKGFHGLYIELKKDKSEVFKKDGTYRVKWVYKNKVKQYDHIQEQVKMHERLRAEGYHVVWGFGLDDTIEKIRDYMKPNKKDIK